MAEALAREATQLAHSAEAPLLQAEAHADLAEVLQLAGKLDDAREEFLQAAKLSGAKGDIVSAARAALRAEGIRSV